MGSVAIDLDETRLALKQTSALAADLLRSLPDAGAAIRSSPWTIRDAAVHLAVDIATNTDAVLGIAHDYAAAVSARTPDRMVELNARAVREVEESDPLALGDLVAGAVADFLAACEAREGDELVATPWYGDGTSLDLDAMACVMLGEVIVHGYDMARAAGRPWKIQPHHAALVLSGVADMLPLYIDPTTAAGLRSTYDIRIRGGQAFAVTIDAGVATIGASRGDVDCHISADPVALLLVAYGRRSQWGPILQTKMLAWGRRPWRALTFRGLFANP